MLRNILFAVALFSMLLSGSLTAAAKGNSTRTAESLSYQESIVQSWIVAGSPSADQFVKNDDPNKVVFMAKVKAGESCPTFKVPANYPFGFVAIRHNYATLRVETLKAGLNWACHLEVNFDGSVPNTYGGYIALVESWVTSEGDGYDVSSSMLGVVTFVSKGLVCPHVRIPVNIYPFGFAIQEYLEPIPNSDDSLACKMTVIFDVN